jgi:hypothetical protein
MNGAHLILAAAAAVPFASACSSSVPRAAAVQPVPDSKVALAAAPAAPSTAGDRSEADVDGAMRQRGYRPETYHGQRVYCRGERPTGSNLESKVCLTAKQIEDQERAAKDVLSGNRAAGCLPKTGCN